MPRKIAKALVVKTQSGFHVRAIGHNGEPLFTTENYENRDWANEIAEDLGVPVEEVDESGT